MSTISNDAANLAQQLGQAVRVHRHDFGAASNPAFQKAFASAAEAAGTDPSKIADLRKQVDAAAQQARQSESSGTDRRRAVQAAVDNVLKQNGVDLQKFHDAMRSQFEKAGGPRGASPQAPPQNDGDADDAPGSAIGKLFHNLDTTA